MRLKILLFSVMAFAFIVAPSSAAQRTLPPANWQEDGPHTHAEHFLNLLVRGDTEAAFKRFFSKGRYPKNTLEKLQFDYYQLIKQQGLPQGFEKIFEQRAGAALVRLKYVLLFRSQPMMFDLYYYRVEKGWLLKSFTLSKDIKKIFAP